MKNILILTALIISGILHAQNIELLKQANKSDLSFARTMANEVVASSDTKYDYYDAVESKYLSTNTLIYIKEGLSDAERKSVDADIFHYRQTQGKYPFENENCLSFHFNVSPAKEYTFDTVTGKFADLFPYYQKNIEPTATPDKRNTVGGIYSIRKDAAGYWYNFARKSNNLWYLKNMSPRIR